MLNKFISLFKCSILLGTFICLSTVVSGSATYNSTYKSFTSIISSVFSYESANQQTDKALGFQKQCELKDFNACAILSIMYYKGYGVERDLNKSFELSKNGCDHNNAGSCVILGALYLKGENVSRNPTIAKELFKNSCDNNEGFGCAMLGSMYYDGKGDVAQDFATAQALFQKGCNLNDGASCVVLSNMYLAGIAVEPDLSIAKNLVQKSCDLNFGIGCGFLGKAYYNGIGTEADISAAIAALEKGCSLNDGESCNSLGLIHRSTNLELAKNFFQKGCDLSSGAACYALGIINYDPDKDSTFSLELFPPFELKSSNKFKRFAYLIYSSNFSCLFLRKKGFNEFSKLFRGAFF